MKYNDQTLDSGISILWDVLKSPEKRNTTAMRMSIVSTRTTIRDIIITRIVNGHPRINF